MCVPLSPAGVSTSATVNVSMQVRKFLYVQLLAIVSVFIQAKKIIRKFQLLAIVSIKICVVNLFMHVRKKLFP